MKYTIVKDIDELKQFIEWLPDLKRTEKYYVSLFARNKYKGTPGLKADKQQLKRFTSDKKLMLEKILKLEVSKGLYTSNGLVINEESLALYISPNPRDMTLATLRLSSKIAKKVEMGYVLDNPHSLAMDMIQTAGNKHTKYFQDIDIDLTELGLSQDREPILADILEKIVNFVDLDSVTIIGTHGGFHFLVQTKSVRDEFKSKWFLGFSNMVSDLYKITMNGDNLIPVPGCAQGGKFPKMLNKK